MEWLAASADELSHSAQPLGRPRLAPGAMMASVLPACWLPEMALAATRTFAEASSRDMIEEVQTHQSGLNSIGEWHPCETQRKQLVPELFSLFSIRPSRGLEELGGSSKERHDWPPLNARPTFNLGRSWRRLAFLKAAQRSTARTKRAAATELCSRKSWRDSFGRMAPDVHRGRVHIYVQPLARTCSPL